MGEPLFDFDLIPISNEDFEYFRGEIFKRAGITMSEAKRNLIQTRLRHRVNSLSLKGFAEYRGYLQTLSDQDEEWQQFINLLTTNKTEWFRESQHFHFLIHDFLPAWLSLNQKTLKVWCAASSTGQEAYSLAMTLKHALAGTGRDFEILATDIDTKVLAYAENGVYPAESLNEIPNEYHADWRRGKGGIQDWIRINNDLRSKIRFQPFNLTGTPYGMDDRFDLIFCRNVMIYFSRETILKVVEALFQVAAKDSMLFIAHSESLQNYKTSWKYFKPSLYSKGTRFDFRKKRS